VEIQITREERQAYAVHGDSGVHRPVRLLQICDQVLKSSVSII
jgi:hypothetical protein